MKAVWLENTPASSQGVFSTGGYEAQVSISHYKVQPKAQTDQGYTVYSSLQSTLLKE